MLTFIMVMTLVAMFLYFVLRIGQKNEKEPEKIYIKTLGKNLYLRPHATQRIFERGISIESLKTMLESPESKAEIQKNGRIRITNEKITAILQLNGDDLSLVTTFRNGRSRSR